MGRRQGMTLEERQRAIGMLHAGMTARAVARHFNRHESTISRFRNRLRETERVNDRPRLGRPRKTTPREDRHITTLSRRNRFMSGGKIARDLMNTTGTRLCLRTVKNRLRAARLKVCRPYVGIPLTHRHRQERLQWGRGIVHGHADNGTMCYLPTNRGLMYPSRMAGFKFGVDEVEGSTQATLSNEIDTEVAV